MKTLPWLLPLALAACTPAPDADAPAPAAAGGMAASTATLTRYHWQLHDAVDARNRRLDTLFGQTDHPPLQLDFSADQLSVSNACNAIGSDYRIVDGHLIAATPRQTMMACSDATLAQREATIKAVLQGKPALIVSSAGDTPLLTLATAGGQTLTFAGQPTAATRHGGPGATVFLEVAAQTVSCQAAGGTCLQVRERHYDANGRSVGEPGPWQLLAQGIEDYRHQPGVRSVLRVQRYAPERPRAGAPPSAYVLDQVLESETVKAPDAKQR
jgi:heat shock protein HslJ